ncbi:LytR C-terminal domain-containing protein [Actinosynnema sp. CS-041913]|uniref:LytR C-terminal domain-containing protein n=1 Tax=Actinosynnema sp. CS-041913 TaxID=3239917 RepID=UPI003D8B9865
MTNPEPAGSSHPTRAAGFTLLGVGAVALVIGVISLFTGGSDSGAQQTSTPPSSQQGTTDTAPGTTSSAATQTSPSSPSSPTAPAETTTTPATTTNPATTTAAPPVTLPAKPPVRVYNNSTTIGLATEAADDVRRAGWEVAGTGNYSQGVIPTTTVYYRPGTDEEASAQQLGQVLKAEVKPRFDGIEGAHPGIIVIVTNDYQGPSGKS